MLELYRPALTGAQVTLTAIDVLSNNIANLQTPGFRASRVEFADLLYRQLTPQEIGLPSGDTSILPRVGTGVAVVATTPSTRVGPMRTTGRPLDIAIEGAGYFPVTLANGSTGYTRAGVFRAGSDGSVMTPDGLRLQPRIDLPEIANELRVQPDGEVISLDAAGATQSHGRIQLAIFPNPNGLESIGSNLFQQTAASGAPTLQTPGQNAAGLLQGATLELANTDLAEEFANSIVIQRAFQMNLAALRQADEMMGLIARLGQ